MKIYILRHQKLKHIAMEHRMESMFTAGLVFSARDFYSRQRPRSTQSQSPKLGELIKGYCPQWFRARKAYERAGTYKHPTWLRAQEAHNGDILGLAEQWAKDDEEHQKNTSRPSRKRTWRPTRGTVIDPGSARVVFWGGVGPPKVLR